MPHEIIVQEEEQVGKREETPDNNDTEEDLPDIQGLMSKHRNMERDLANLVGKIKKLDLKVKRRQCPKDIIGAVDIEPRTTGLTSNDMWDEKEINNK